MKTLIKSWRNITMDETIYSNCYIVHHVYLQDDELFAVVAIPKGRTVEKLKEIIKNGQ